MGTKNGADDLASLAKKNLQHRQAIQMAAKLSGTSFWTASNPFTPFLFFAGVAATLPSIYGFVHHLWSATSLTFMGSITWGAVLPLNLLPIIFCRNLPPLLAAATIGLLGGVYHVMSVRGRRQE